MNKFKDESYDEFEDDQSNILVPTIYVVMACIVTPLFIVGAWKIAVVCIKLSLAIAE